MKPLAFSLRGTLSRLAFALLLSVSVGGSAEEGSPSDVNIERRSPYGESVNYYGALPLTIEWRRVPCTLQGEIELVSHNYRSGQRTLAEAIFLFSPLAGYCAGVLGLALEGFSAEIGPLPFVMGAAGLIVPMAIAAFIERRGVTINFLGPRQAEVNDRLWWTRFYAADLDDLAQISRIRPGRLGVHVRFTILEREANIRVEMNGNSYTPREAVGLLAERREAWVREATDILEEPRRGGTEGEDSALDESTRCAAFVAHRE